MRMSDACPLAPPSGWWMSTRAWGSAARLPLAPEHSRMLPMDAAIPVTVVATSGEMRFIVSMMESPAETLPPGVFRYMVMSAVGFWDVRYRSWAVMMFATSLLISVPRTRILSIMRRLNTSIDATLRALSSMMVGFM